MNLAAFRTAGRVIALAGALFAFAAVATDSATCLALGRPALSAYRRAQQQMEEAKRDYQKQRQEVADQEKSLRTAQTELSRAKKDVERVTQRLEAEHEKTAGVQAARKAADQIRSQYHELTAPLIETLHASPEYVAAKEEARLADANIREIRENESLTSEEQLEHSAKWAERARHPAELEQKLLERHPAASQLRKKLAEAEAAVHAAVARAEKEFENDPEYKAVRRDYAKHREAVEAEERKLERSQAELLRARNHSIVASRKAANERDDAKRPNRKRGGK